MKMKRWTPEAVCNFIDVYRTKDILWDTRNVNYFNKKLKYKAWTEISVEMNHRFTVNDLKKRMVSLLGQLRREKCRAKVKNQRRGSNELYTPTWYAYDHMKFLLNRKMFRKRLTVDTSDENSVSQDDHSNNDPLEFEEAQQLHAVDEEQSETGVKSKNLPVDVKEEQRPNETMLGNTSHNSNYKPMSNRQNYSDNSKNQTMPQFQSCAASAGPVPAESATANAASSFMDDNQLYANFLASKFRLYSQHTKNVLQHRISDLLYQADIGLL